MRGTPLSQAYLADVAACQIKLSKYVHRKPKKFLKRLSDYLLQAPHPNRGQKKSIFQLVVFVFFLTKYKKNKVQDNIIRRKVSKRGCICGIFKINLSGQIWCL